jgi:hypothetical protein
LPVSEPFFTPEQIANIRPLSDAPKEWQQLYLGTFRQQLEPAHLLWVWYYEKTETFDQSVCRAQDKRGIAVPVTPEEQRLCSEHARRCMKIVEAAAGMLGISRGELTDTRMVSRGFDNLDHLRQLLKDLDPKVRSAIAHAENWLIARSGLPTDTI